MLMEQTNLCHFRILLAILLLLLRIPATLSEVVCYVNPTDKQAVNSLTSTMTESVPPPNWENNSSCVCQWTGVSCSSNSSEGLRVQRLNLSGMNLHGPIPGDFWKLSALVHLNLSNNSLSGSLPFEIRDLSALQFLDLSSNNLTDWIPKEAGELKSLTHLSLANNHLIGAIPKNISDLKNLRFLNLSFNNLSGEFPGKWLESLARLNLTQLDVSHNRLKGNVPCGGALIKFPKNAFTPNDHLGCHCPPLYSAKRTSLFTCVFMGIAIALLALGFAFMVLKHVLDSVKLYKELHEATNGFRENNKLKPEGRFGSVYKGSLPNLGHDEKEATQKEVAVKVFKLEEIELTNFEAESKRLRGMDRHRNLTPVIGSCSLTSVAMVIGRRTYREFKALVMKFMPNGSLEGCLHSENCSMDIKRRLEIMTGVASGLEHLHERGLLHGDLKPSNVLLDEVMVAHLSDFGITKSEKTKQQQPTSDEEQADRPKLLPTPGYSDPEYELKTSARSDVYSFGIMLMETFTGKKPTDKMFGPKLSLRHWVKEALDNSTVNKVMDADLIREGEEEFEAKVKCVSSILELALKCSEELAADRADIKDVAVKLKTILQDEQLP